MQKMCTKSQRPLLYFGNEITQNIHGMQEILLKIRYFGKGLSKNPKTVNFLFFFRTQSLFMGKFIKNKTLLELVTSHSSGYKTSSQ